MTDIAKQLERYLDPKTLAALQTQYQFCPDALRPRDCQDAPTPLQLSRIREAHNNIYRTLVTMQRLLSVIKRQHEALEYYQHLEPEGFKAKFALRESAPIIAAMEKVR